MIQRTTVRLPVSLMRRAKKRATADGTTVTALMEDGLRRVLDERDRGPDRPRIMPRISSASGPPMTGGAEAEIARLKLIQELDDLEYVARMNRGFR